MFEPYRGVRAHGQALVEMALVLGVLLLLLLGLVSVFQLLLANYTVTQAVRAAAHQAAIEGGSSAAAQNAARIALDSGIGTRAGNAQELSVQCERTPCRRYDPIRVRIIYRDRFWAPLWPGMQTFQVVATAVRTAERDQQ